MFYEHMWRYGTEPNWRDGLMAEKKGYVQTLLRNSVTYFKIEQHKVSHVHVEPRTRYLILLV